MAWNEPGKDKDPWTRGKNDGPPELGEAFKKLEDKLNRIFGGGGGGSSRQSDGNPAALIGLLLVVVFGVYGLSGFYTVDTKERAVVLEFGAFKEIKTEGLNWNAPLITKVFKVNVTAENQYPARGLMLTKNESIVDLAITVQYNVSDVRAFVLNVRDPDVTLKNATDSALRHVVGSTELDQVLSEGRAKIAAEVKQRLQSYLDSYASGINVININMQEARAPEEVRPYFDEVIRAKEDQEKVKSEAEAYANQIVPEARGRSQRIVQEAEAYKSEVVSKAQGESERFEKLVAEYKRAPEVTRKRLYLDTVESMMSNSSKVMVDVDNNSVMYLPLDKLAKQLPLQSAVDSSTQPAVVPQSQTSVNIEPTKSSGRRELR